MTTVGKMYDVFPVNLLTFDTKNQKKVQFLLWLTDSFFMVKRVDPLIF